MIGKPIRTRMLGQLANVDPKIAQRVAAGLGHRGTIDPVATTKPVRPDLKPSTALSIQMTAKPTAEGRTIGCLVADGTDASIVAAARAAAKQAGANFKVIAPMVEAPIGSGGQAIEADFQLAGGSSVLFDAVFIALTAEAATKLSKQPGAVGFVADAYSHLKVIGFLPSAQVLLTKAGVDPDDGVISVSSALGSYMDRVAKGRLWSREAAVRPVL